MPDRLTPAAVRAITDAELDRRVAEAMGWKASAGGWIDQRDLWHAQWSPSRNWQDAGEAMEWMAGKGWEPALRRTGAQMWVALSFPVDGRSEYHDIWPLVSPSPTRAISEALVLAADAAAEGGRR